MKIFTSDMMREIEAQAEKRSICTMEEMMRNAGAGAVRFMRKKYELKNKSVVIVAGKGNNGGDGFVCARLLYELGAVVTVILAEGYPKSELARSAYKELPTKVYKISFADNKKSSVEIINSSDFIIDAMFGFGFHGRITGNCEALVKIINESHGIVISLDVPSGVLCDSGEILGECIAADYTVTFTALKPAHLLYPAKEKCGEVTVSPVGIPFSMTDEYKAAIEGYNFSDIKPFFKKRDPISNKGDYGRLLLICGSYGMAGAAIMAARAALRCGIGLLNMAVPKDIYDITASSVPEAVFSLYDKDDTKEIEKALAHCDAVVIGCGLSKSELSLKILDVVIQKAECPLIIDADGINLLSEHIDLLKNKKDRVILTPHPKEMSLLIGKSVSEIQSDRIDTAKNTSQKLDATIVLKGSGTVVAFPEGELYLNLSGNAGMAKGGNGDVLSGMIGAFEAMKMPEYEAVSSAVFLHGIAGDRCAERLSQTSMQPTDMIEELPLIFLEIER